MAKVKRQCDSVDLPSNQCEKERLPLTFDPIRFAQKRRVLSGGYSVAAFEGLADLVDADLAKNEQLKVDVACGIDERQVTYLKGRICGKLPLVCQRCMKPLFLKLDIAFAVTPVQEISETKMNTLYHPVVVDEHGKIALRDIVEEEVLLQIPLIPKHDLEDCAAKEELANLKAGRKNPFSVLQSLKNSEVENGSSTR